MAMEHPPRVHINAPPPHRPRYSNGPEDWDKYKQEIGELYAKKELKDVMKYMEDTHSFKATRKQWTTRLKKWDFTKRNEAPDYRAMLKKKRQREQERPGVPSQFILRDEEVPASKIARWEDRARKEGKLANDDTLSDVVTPPGLLCRTPPSARAFISTPANQDVLTTDIFDQRVSPTASLLALNTPLNERHRLSREASITPESDQPPLLNLNISTPPPLPFGSSEAYANHNLASASPANSVAISNSDLLVKLLRGFARTIINNEDKCSYTNIVEGGPQGLQCICCRLTSYLAYVYRQHLLHDVQFSKTEIFLGALIGCTLLTDNESSTGSLAGIERKAGVGLCRMGNYTEVESLLLEALKVNIEIEDGTQVVVQRTVIELAAHIVRLGMTGKAESLLENHFPDGFHHFASICAIPCQDCIQMKLICEGFLHRKVAEKIRPSTLWLDGDPNTGTGTLIAAEMTDNNFENEDISDSSLERRFTLLGYDYPPAIPPSS